MSIHQQIASEAVDVRALESSCREVQFRPGERLRLGGQHYTDMYLLIDGKVEVDLVPGSRKDRLVLTGHGQPVGEIGFLRGSPATATVTALAPTRALLIDDPTLARLEAQQPAAIAALLRRLAEVADERTSQNLVLFPSAGIAGGGGIEVLMCRDAEMLRRAQQLRYEVYCEELGRKSPFADHEKRIITDDLDRFGHTLIAIEAGEVIGTLRGNLPSEGPLGSLVQIYGMAASPHYPDGTAICTKFIVRKSKRGGPAAMKLISAMVRFGLRHGVKECFIDCVPSLLHYYQAVGFSVVGPKFLHRENGLSLPMAIDVVKHGPRLSTDQGPREYLKLFIKAQAIRVIDAVRGRRTMPSAA